jgi:hypothetical protein
MPIRYTSDVLYHFVGFRNPGDHETNYSTLLKILEDRAVTHWPHNARTPGQSMTLDWDADIEKGELIVPEVTCFCDIPYEALSVHLRKYGSFGIAFRRFFLVKKGGRPVTYVPLQSKDRLAGWGTIYSLTMIRDWMRVREGFYEQVVAPVEANVVQRPLGVKPSNPDDAILAIDDFLARDFFAFLKVFDSDLTEELPDNYYMEREWRKLGNLKFFMEDVAFAIVDASYITRLALEKPELCGKILPAPL